MLGCYCCVFPNAQAKVILKNYLTRSPDAWLGAVLKLISLKLYRLQRYPKKGSLIVFVVVKTYTVIHV